MAEHRPWTGAECAAGIVILLLALFLRVWPIGSALPYLTYIDEGHVLHQSMRVLHEHTYDTRLYDYPSLPSYLITAAAVAYAPVYQQLRGRSFWADLPTSAELDAPLGEIYDLISPPDFIVLGRAVVVMCSIGTVLLTGLLALRISGPRTALVAMWLVAVCPALVSRSSIIIVDTVAAFFVMAALFFAQRLKEAVLSRDRPSWRYAAYSGLAAGFAAASKYPAGAVFAALVTTILLLPLVWRAKTMLLVISGTGLFVGSVAGMPALLLQPATILGTWRYLVQSYDEIVTNVTYWDAAISTRELGLPLLIAGAAGVVLLLRSGGVPRAAAIAWSSFAGLLLGVMIGSRFQPFRNLIALVPLLSIAAAFALDRFHSAMGRRAFLRLVPPATALLLGLSLLAPAVLEVRERLARIDTRVLAVDWLQQHSAAQTRILGLRELGILPSEWKRVGANSSVVPWADALGTAEQQAFDYIATGDMDLRLAPDPSKWADYLTRWNGKTAAWPIAADFGSGPTFLIPNFWRMNDEKIVIRRSLQKSRPPP